MKPTSRFARSHRLAAWVGVALLAIPTAAWADSFPDEIPYVYPMVLAQFMTPVGSIDGAKNAIPGWQAAYNNGKQAIIAAGNSVQAAVTAVQNLNPGNVVATAAAVQQDLQNATNSVNQAKAAINGVTAVSLYGIDDQVPFFGQRLGGDGIPYDQLAAQGADLVEAAIESVFARTDDITVGVTGTHKVIYPDPNNHVTGEDVEFYTTNNTDFTVTVAGSSFNHHSGNMERSADALDDLRDQINNASGLPVTASTDDDGVHLYLKGKHKWTGNNYSVSVASVLDDAVSSPPCGTPATIINNIGDVMCTWTGADSEVDIILGSIIADSHAVPTLSLSGSGANQKLTITYALQGVAQVNAQVIADTLKYTPGAQHNVVTASTWVNFTLHAVAKDLSLSPIDLDQLFTTDDDGNPILNPNFVTLTLDIESPDLKIDGLDGALESLGAEGGLISGLILGTLLSGGNPIGTVVGGILGLIAGIIGGGVASDILEDKIKKAIDKEVKEQSKQVQKQLKDEVTKQLTKYSTQIQQIKDDVTKAQAYETTLATTLSYLGLSLKNTYQVFNNPNPMKETYNPHNGVPIYTDAVRQELAAAVEVHLPAPPDRSMTVSGTLVLPEHTCNYGPIGGSGNSQQWTVDIGPLGLDEINGDLAGVNCATILQNDLKVNSYLGSTPTQSTTSEFGAVLTPQWTPIPLHITGTPLAKVSSNGSTHYECGFTLTQLPSYSITRIGLTPNGNVSKRMHLDSKGSFSNALVGADYANGDIADISHAMRNTYFRTMLLGPNTSDYIASLTTVIQKLQTLVAQLGSAGAPFAADLAKAKALLAEIASFSTLDELARPATNFRLGYAGVSNQWAECPVSSDSGGSLIDDVNNNGGPANYQMWEMYMYGSWD